MTQVWSVLTGQFSLNKFTPNGGKNKIQPSHLSHSSHRVHPGHPSHLSHPSYPSHPAHPSHRSHHSHHTVVISVTLGHPGYSSHPGHHGHSGHPRYLSHLGHPSRLSHLVHPSHPSPLLDLSVSKWNWLFQRVFPQRAKKVMSDGLGQVDFAIGQVNSVFNLHDGQVMFFEQFK